MSHHGEYRQWPFLDLEEFELACAFFDQKYVRAKLGPSRRIFKIRLRRTATTGTSYIEILRLLQLPEDDHDLSRALESLSGLDDSHGPAMDVAMANEEADQDALHSKSTPDSSLDRTDAPPQYSLYSHQPFVTYEIHLHQTYNVPTLWFTLHDLPIGEPTFDLDSVYRYLVPPELKSRLRAAGITGGISAAPHPLTSVPAFFIHPCHTKEAMEIFDCPMTDYMTVWIGLVGGSVGLWLPPEMVQGDDPLKLDAGM